MTKQQFRVLYRQFLFRVVDLELLSQSGDIGRLLGRFASLLIIVSIIFSMRAFGLDSSRTPYNQLLIEAWPMQHAQIDVTMLTVGLFAVLSWDSMFPDRRDAFVLGPLPLRIRTLFLAKVMAVASALGLTIVALNALPGLVLPFALTPANRGLLDVIFTGVFYRLLAAYWITMAAAGAFVFCGVLVVQGLAAFLLPRRRFLRLSAFLQMAAFTLFLSVYLLAPSVATPAGLAAPHNQGFIAWLPSYWFLGLYQTLNGSTHPAVAGLLPRALIALAVALLGAAVAYVLSYSRILRKVVEEPDIVASSRRIVPLPRCGSALDTAVVHFSLRSLLRSRQHRVTLAFYIGIGLAVVTALIKAGVGRGRMLGTEAYAPLMFASLVVMTIFVVGVRVAFTMPLALRSNWIFRITELRPTRQYLAAIRRSLLVLGVAPVWAGCTLVFAVMWPWRVAAVHLSVLGLWGLIVAFLSLRNFRKIPFTCSYLPGKSAVHMAFLSGIGLIQVLARGVGFEIRALGNQGALTMMIGVLVLGAAIARWFALRGDRSDDTIVQFEEEMPPAVMELGLHRDGALVLD